MRSIRIIIAFTVLTHVLTTPAPAQSLPANPADGARAGLQGWYRNGGVDWEASMDSFLVLNSLRLRGSIGHGRWEGINAEPLEGGHFPGVTSLAASLILTRGFNDPYTGRTDEHVRWFAGAGIAAYLPHAPGGRTQRGLRIVLGMDFAGRRWSVGPEIDAELPAGLGEEGFATLDLFPTVHGGIAIRRVF
jgi:hypothetical protein